MDIKKWERRMIMMLKWYVRSDHEHVGLGFSCTFSWSCDKDTKARVYGPGIQGFRFRILQSRIQIEGFRFRVSGLGFRV